jgi:hypothetical protein
MIRTSGLLVVASLAVSGCGIEPWVPAYDRGLLAEPHMRFDRDPISSRYRQHVNATREGARGAGSATGGGCGCN